MRTPLAIIGVLLAVLVPVGFATDDGGSGPAVPAAAPVRVIAERVERLRGLRFDRIPRPVRVSAARARRDGLADLDRGYPAARRRADEALYTLLGLLPPGTDLRKLGGSIFGEQVAGYYDPRTKALRIVEGAGTSNRVMDEMVIAHELTHALEDQAVGLDAELADRSGDASTAYLALVEGTATEVMYDYLQEHFESGTALGGLLGGVLAQGAGGAELPPFVLDGLVFPYVEGQQFVSELRRRAGGRWTLADLATRTRPPASTEQVLHPEKWIVVEAPRRVRLRGVRDALGRGHARLAHGVFGEWRTAELLGISGLARAEAAAGWGGDRYELWRRDAGAPCKTPCVGRDTLVIRWTWDTRADAEEFTAALRDALEDGLDAEPRGDAEWDLRGGAVAVGGAADAVTLALAPDAGTARRVID